MDGSRIRKEKVADSKISVYVWTGPQFSVSVFSLFTPTWLRCYVATWLRGYVATWRVCFGSLIKERVRFMCSVLVSAH